MNCPNCGFKNRRGVKFCENCGHDFSSAPAPRGKSTVFCANCGSRNAVGSRFCFKCGNALEGIAAPAQAVPQVVVIQQPERRRSWLGLLALLLLLLFGCALISSLVQVTPAMARKLPGLLQDPAIAFGRWQQEADILRRVRQGTTWVTTAWNEIFGGDQTARQENNTADDQQFGVAPPEAPLQEPDTGASNSKLACPDLSQLEILPDTFESMQISGEEFPDVVYIDTETGPNETPPSWVGYEDAPWMIQYNMEALNQASFQTCSQAELIGDNGIGLVCEGPRPQSGLAAFTLQDIERMRVWVEDRSDCAAGWLEFPAQQIASAQQPENGGPPMISVSQNTMCRKGPGSNYDAIGDLQVGETAEIVAQYSGGDYWVIENYGASGTCWLYGGYAEISGDAGSLPYWEAPAPPVVEEPEPEVAPEEEAAGTMTFTFNNYLENAWVCELRIRPASSGSWGSNLIGSSINPQSSQSITIPNQGDLYDLKVLTCVEGPADEFIESGVTITEGASYPFKPY